MLILILIYLLILLILIIGLYIFNSIQYNKNYTSSYYRSPLPWRRYYYGRYTNYYYPRRYRINRGDRKFRRDNRNRRRKKHKNQ